MTTAVKSPKLLVSVRSAEEAKIALAEGADLIDVKDPDRGPLGMAHHETVADVLKVIQGAKPVSAALGEWSTQALTDAVWHLELPLDYIKWGLGGYPFQPGWGEDLLESRRQVPKKIEVVLVAYADHEQAKCPPAAEVVKFARRFRYTHLMFDTFAKDGQTLLDRLSLNELTEMIASLQRAKIQVALAGSLRLEQLPSLLPLNPNVIAVRGAVCVGGKRTESLDAVRIRKWKSALN